MRDDLDCLQGSWRVMALKVEGQAMPAEMLARAAIVIKGKRFTSSGMGAVYKGTLELDTTASPRRLDMKFDAGPERGAVNRGIYQLRGDTWKICLSTCGGGRPSDFRSTAGSGFACETLTRGEVPAAVKVTARVSKTPAAPRRGTATSFEGEWRMVSGVMDGQPMDKSMVKWLKRVTEGNQTTVYAGPQVMMKFELTTDESKSPRAIDYFHTGGSSKGKSQQGIYEFEGDLLKIFVSAPGCARPMQFRTTPGDDGTLTLWKRA
jgi:uncharacterized protein (TIGR03067 family)